LKLNKSNKHSNRPNLRLTMVVLLLKWVLLLRGLRLLTHSKHSKRRSPPKSKKTPRMLKPESPSSLVV
jgi:cell division protein FtsN